MLRRGMMRGAATPNGWHKLTLTADQDYQNAATTLGFIRAALPASYRYAVALADDTESPGGNAFLGTIFMPSATVKHVLRWRDQAYNQVTMKDSDLVQISLVIGTGETISLLWRDTPITDDAPATSWGYACIQPGEISRADVLGTALSGVGTWDVMLAVADLDFGIIPATNQTYCESITKNSANITGTYIRTSNGTYAGVNNWDGNYSCIVSADTKIACFYL